MSFSPLSRARSRFMQRDDSVGGTEMQKALLMPDEMGVDDSGLAGGGGASSGLPMRELFINDRARNVPHKFCDNSIKTSKYSIIPLSVHFFLWKNLFEQFLKAANVYFLFISVMQVIPGLSPTGRFTTLLPLCIVLFLTLVKDVWEDWKRHVQDHVVNTKMTLVLRQNLWTHVEWRHVEVGDVLLVKKNEPFPADLLSLWSPELDGNSYIETASLDGETNLKLRKSTQAFYPFLERLPKGTDHTPQFTGSGPCGRIVCELPNNRLYQFNGYVERAEHPDLLGGSVAGGARRVPLQRVTIVPDNVLLRGAELRNVKCIIGAAIFTGEDSKLAQNFTAKHHKLPRLDSVTNQQIGYVFLVQIVLAIVCAIGFSASDHQFGDATYLTSSTSSNSGAAISFITFLILYNSFIPISLYIMMEVVKVIQASLIDSDVLMYTEASDTPAMVRNSKLNEELGQVEFVFSDKTGTLTCNVMEFRHFCTPRTDVASGNIVASLYGDALHDIGASASATVVGKGGVATPRPPPNAEVFTFTDRRITGGAWRNERNREEIRALLEAMAVCHTVIPEREGGRVVYQASSPDEGCLVNAARHLGLELVSRSEKEVRVRDMTLVAAAAAAAASAATTTTTTADGGAAAAAASSSAAAADTSAVGYLTWQVLCVIEFNSSRKRMSMVARDPLGRVVVLTKGADNVMMERLRHGDATQAPLYEQTVKALGAYASEGLRTLVFARATISEDIFKRWHKKYTNVPFTGDRQAKLDEVAEELERDMELLGCTAIEDRLQDQVPETIQLLARAGVKLWVLTGDKLETAMNIAFSCSLLNRDMGLFTFDQCHRHNIHTALEKYMSDVESAALEAGQDVGLIIQGTVLEFILPAQKELGAPGVDENEANADMFVSLAIKCKSVICCRVSPIQKAKVVEAVKLRVHGVTLAIGDGANDVSMIQMAHVGVGISGLEGLQAARASDYSISQFQHLQRLVLVHGRWNYRRIAKLIIFTFYKNVALYLTQFFFATYNMFTGQTLYDAWALAMYNLAFTALPIMSLAVFDKDVEARRVITPEQFPELFQDGIKGRLFNTREFWSYMGNALLHSVWCFFLCLYAAFDLKEVDTGRDLGMNGQSVIAYSVILGLVTAMCGLEINTWTLLNVLVFFLSIYFWFVFLLLYCSAYQYVNFGDFASWYGVDSMALGHPCHWLLLLLVVTCALARDIAVRFYRRNYEPQLSDVVQEFEVKVGVGFTRHDVKRETPWLFPKQEVKAFKPSLSSGIGTQRFVAQPMLGGSGGGGESGTFSQLLGGSATAAGASSSALLARHTSESFYHRGATPGRRVVKISQIIEDDDI